MAYNTPASKTTGDLITAADWAEIGTNFAAILTCEVIAIFDGGAATLTTTTFVDIPIDFKGTIADAELYITTPGATSDWALTVDVWKDHSTDFPPTSDDYITGSAKLIASTATGQFANITISSWTTALTAGDVLRFAVESVTTVKKATAKLTVNRSS